MGKYAAYHRTSTKDQHLDRGIAELTAYCKNNGISLYKNKVYTDQKTGKNFDRPRYQMLKEEILEKGDCPLSFYFKILGLISRQFARPPSKRFP